MHMGGHLHDEEPVTSITPGKPTVTVTTSKASYKAHNLVVTAGPWTNKLTRPIGLSLPLKVRIQPNTILLMHFLFRHPATLGGRRHYVLRLSVHLSVPSSEISFTG